MNTKTKLIACTELALNLSLNHEQRPIQQTLKLYVRTMGADRGT